MNVTAIKPLILLLFVSLALLSVQTKASAQQKRYSDLSIELRLTSYASMLRVGTDSIPLTLEVRNVGTEAFTIDKGVLWGGIELRDAGDAEVQFISIVCGLRPKSNFVVLEPKTSLWAHLDYSLKRTWFEDGGSYCLSLRYKNVKSNKIAFEFINEDREVEVQNDDKR